MKFWKNLLGMSLVSLLLGACGGGGGGSGSPCAAASCGTASSSSSSSSGGSTSYQISLVSSSATILTNGTDTVTLQAVVQDSSFGAASGVTVIFAVTSGGGALSTSSATTDSTGVATATYNTNTNKTNRSITIAAQVSGSSASASTSLTASGTTVSISGLTSTVVGQSLAQEAVVTDAAGKGVASQTVTLAVTSGTGSVSTTMVTTDSLGKASFNYVPPSSGATTAVISATALGATATKTVTVSGVTFSFTSPSAGTQIEVNTCSPLPLTAQLTGASGPLTFATSIGGLYTTSSCSGSGSTTLSNVALSGTSASVWAKATNTGTATVTAVAPGTTGSTSTTIQFISSTPASMTLNASPSTVSASSTSTITAFVKDATGNPVANQTVFFSISGGGSISASGTTDPNGLTTATFTAGATLTGLNGIVVTAQIPSASPVVSTTTSLTIAGQGVTVDIGFDNLIEKISSPPIYRKIFVVTVLDSNRSPVANQTVTMSLNINNYLKGYYVAGSSTWAKLATSPTCANEDTNNNGVLDAGEVDVNGNGTPDPVTGTVVKSEDGASSGSSFTVTTGTDGKAIVLLEYPQNQAAWLQVTVGATASVQGTNSSATTALWLPVLGSDLTDTTVQPPNYTSPYGTSAVCTDTL